MAKRYFTQTFGVVGALIKKNGKFLLVQEAGTMDAGKWNQPAGWIDIGENPIKAVKREVREETGYDFKPTHLLGIYSLARKDLKLKLKGLKRTGFPHAIKLIFIGKTNRKPLKKITSEIKNIRWFTDKEIFNMPKNKLRDLDIKKLVKDYQKGEKYPLTAINHTVAK